MPRFRHCCDSAAAPDNLRIIITRHGERADLAFGRDWIHRAKKRGGYDPRVSYLTPRSNFLEWSVDPPLTVVGERQAMAVGRKLSALGLFIDYCYSSPAYRSIQTASKILEGQGNQGVPINIEHGLFECPIWYADVPLKFLPAQQLAADGSFNIDSSYRPQFNSVDPSEDERGYYRRSRHLVDAIVKAHKYQGGTILLSGHAGSIDALTRGLLGRPARPEHLQYKADRVNYCDFSVLERDASTGEWFDPPSLAPTNSFGTSKGYIQSSIPLYRATSQYMYTNNFRAPVQMSNRYLFGDRSSRRFQRFPRFHRYYRYYV